MGDKFPFDDEFYPVPPAAVDADPAAAMEDLFDRVAKLEQSLDEQREQALADLRSILLGLLSLYDQITTVIERWGIATKAQEANLIRGVVGVGKGLLAILDHYQVKPIETIGKPLDPETSDVVGTEEKENMPPGIVLREVQTGYTWPHGLLRRAKVIVSAKKGTPS